jgi:DNA/RNA endonuclease G (NUC1)
MPNQASYETVRSFAVSIDSIEKKTGIDFLLNFQNLYKNK